MSKRRTPPHRRAGFDPAPGAVRVPRWRLSRHGGPGIKYGVTALVSAVALSACGLQPLYSGGTASPAAATLGAVEVSPIEGKSGWLVANAVRDRLQAAGSATPRYRLDIRLDDQIVGLGIRRDDSVTRERRTLRARYQLVDLASGTAVVDATAGSDAGIDVVSSEYATIAAESSALERLAQTVADQIVTRVALHARREGAPPSR